jgi:hypothetical protein
LDIHFIKKTLDDVLSMQDFGDEVPDYRTIGRSITLLERKTIFNFRIGAAGKYLNFIQQIVTLEVTLEGRIWLGLI